jgi:hypothetical protein
VGGECQKMLVFEKKISAGKTTLLRHFKYKIKIVMQNCLVEKMSVHRLDVKTPNKLQLL